MRTIKLYAHLLCPIDSNGVTSKHFKAIWIIEQIAQSLARMFNGTTDCSSCGTVQYSDIVIFDNITDEQIAFIIDSHPFIKEIKRY